MDPTVLAWALAQPAGSRAAVLAAAYTGGTTRVSFEGRTVEYRTLDELGRALAVLHGAENSTVRRPAARPRRLRGGAADEGEESRPASPRW
ncbi:phage head-tail joining protein [Falsiroseomonas sp.]|uniref:phage head-tail joining protein n=1 Tax=Falsiroseomonas sp. TaxID=2870721 RepID=UPI003567C8D8